MAPQQQRPQKARQAYIAACVVASLALATGPGYAVGSAASQVDGPAAPSPGLAAPAPAPTAPMAPSPPTAPSAPTAPMVSAAPARPVAPTPPPAPSPPVPPSPSPPPVSVMPSAPSYPASRFPAFGAYLDYGPQGVSRISELGAWLAGAEPSVAHTYLPGDRWSNIEGPPGFLDPWTEWRQERDDRMFVLNVPMLERNEEGLSDHEVRELLRRGAAGEFDHHFRELAGRLVGLGAPDTVLVLGWEMNGTTYTHRCGPDPENWKKYWNRIVTAMRSVPGQEFKFDWAPSRGRDAVPWTECYPGDDTVDIIGMDAYDQPHGLPFGEQVEEPYGLQAHVDFAKAHGKPVSYPEWGLFRNGDNTEYMKGMLAWMDEHKPLYNTLTDYCPHGVWQCSANPKASEIYWSTLAGRTGTPPEPSPSSSSPTTPAPMTPAPTTPVPTTPAATPVPATSVPTTPVRQAQCSPLEMGDWMEYWLGEKLCLRFDWLPPAQ
ncbi:glycoside hydrolase family 26 protein [Streptomyces poonensis]|uniref:GH26 domain-containing protein n=1 Tax=Streptomyces poonensis TaxID=68255 RepID=A0A918UL35_9ACTN|nr:glycosyl hydrolase [Streptomyces poonensis]GGZ17793.1 hypothetical protein GCM10010365_42250 [Streptomyces poonensis]GLJ91007.1 hypothetical protein GCM10017589_36130 [Streptomyces poonensis]